MKVVSGAFGVGSLVRYAGLVNQFVDAFVLLICEVSKMIMNNDYMQDTFEYLDMPKSMHTGHRALPELDLQHCEIKLNHVSFRYPDTEIDVLKDVSLTLTPEKV